MSYFTLLPLQYPILKDFDTRSEQTGSSQIEYTMGRVPHTSRGVHPRLLVGDTNVGEDQTFSR